MPASLRTTGLTYHGCPDRWEGDETLNVVGRGQEFITDISGNAEAAAWLEETIRAIDGEPEPIPR